MFQLLRYRGIFIPKSYAFTKFISADDMSQEAMHGVIPQQTQDVPNEIEEGTNITTELELSYFDCCGDDSDDSDDDNDNINNNDNGHTAEERNNELLERFFDLSYQAKAMRELEKMIDGNQWNESARPNPCFDEDDKDNDKDNDGHNGGDNDGHNSNNN